MFAEVVLLYFLKNLFLIDITNRKGENIFKDNFSLMPAIEIMLHENWN